MLANMDFTVRKHKRAGVASRHLTPLNAMAHKLARILWHLLTYKQPFTPEVFAQAEAKMKRQQLARLQNLAASLNYQLLPQP